MKRLAAAAALLALIPAAPASAALVTTYSMTDDVWGTPIGIGRILIDARAQYVTSTPAALNIPVAAVTFGVMPWLELGANGYYSFTGLFSSGASNNTGPVGGYVKFMAPWHPMDSTLGLVLGGTYPTMTGQSYTVAAEGIASLPLSQTLTLDLNLGAGQRFDGPTRLAHGSASLYYALPNFHTVMVEAFGYYNHLAPGLVLGQRVGYQLPLSSANSLDFSLSVHELSGRLEWMPQVGATIMM